jgi:hypothetical protein
MEETDSTFETTLQVSGRPCEVRLFRGRNGKHYAMTRFSENDTIVSAGYPEFIPCPFG